ncbi:hypothetical protein AZG88_34840 [Rhodococcus sp. LB1]|nr:hypothetical protein AZG88_34840 [Rhodococcus sp. LB1]
MYAHSSLRRTESTRRVIAEDRDEVMTMLGALELFITNALDEKYDATPPHWADMMGVRKLDLREFVESFDAGGYPAERTRGAVTRAYDLKLQYYYLAEVDLGTYNQVYSAEINNRGLSNETATPRLLLIRLSQDQSLIGKMRVLWERLMNLIYYVETGKDIAARSKKKAFFRWLETETVAAKWRYFQPYEQVIAQYDDKFRTPEFHKSSTLRREILERSLDINDLIEPLNYFTNGIWSNIISITKGNGPISFHQIHRNSNGEIDPRYRK